MKLTANELRLGNWIHKYFEGDPVEYTEVTTRTIFDCETNPTGKFHYEGIPLNTIILEHAGFTYKHQSQNDWNISGVWTWKLDAIDFSIIEFMGEGCKYGYELDGKYIEIDYVHELQNAFFIIERAEISIYPVTL